MWCGARRPPRGASSFSVAPVLPPGAGLRRAALLVAWRWLRKVTLGGTELEATRQVLSKRNFPSLRSLEIPGPIVGTRISLASV